MNYKIISTGSQGNAVIVENKILIDCGVPFKDLRHDYKNLKLVLLTHIHSDHFKKATIKKLAAERPTLRFACCHWLVDALLACGVEAKRIDVLETDKIYGYGICNVIPFFLQHNVPNCGYKLHFAEAGKLIYATDCNTLDGISAPGYDLYLIEANYIDEDIEQRIAEKKANGEYSYEIKARQNHLSRAKADDWLYQNMDSHSVYVYMHQHQDKTQGAEE